MLQELVREYQADPNCWPALWIASEPITAEQKAEFIRIVTVNK